MSEFIRERHARQVCAVVLGVASHLLGPANASADVCGCAGSPATLGAFDSADPETWPTIEGRPTTASGTTITIPLPVDGVLVFDSFRLAGIPGSGSASLVFARDRSNPTVHVLVSGDVTVAAGNTIDVRGAAGAAGATASGPGLGGLGGPGGFKGGDAGGPAVNEQAIGGIGFGPGGGAPGNPSGSVTEAGFVGSYGGPPDLLPLVGGSGGGGGSTESTSAIALCGGGGGGGGAILVAANGTLRVDGTIDASGGMGGNYGGSSSFSRPGGSGSGGAIRLLATTVEGSGKLLARGGPTPSAGFGRGSGGAGRIRIEAFQNTLPPSAAEPVAFLGAAPGPLESPLDPRVRIAEVGGAAVSRPPLGFGVALGAVDVVVPAPGRVPVDVETRFVPGGTQVAVTVKPRLGALVPFTSAATLGGCSADGTCRATASFDLAPGDYLIEAEATFAVP